MLGRIHQHENVDHVEGDVGGEAGPDGKQDLLRIAPQQLDQRCLHDLMARLHLFEYRRFLHARPDEEPDADEHDTQEERNAPAP
jgi:hypothetical protein